MLANTTGGVSGAALKPIALRCVYDVARAVSVPIVGTGGVLTGDDVVEMLSAGACCVGVGTAIAIRGERALALILEEVWEWLAGHGLTLDEVRGRALHRGTPAVTNPPPVPGWEKRHAG